MFLRRISCLILFLAPLAFGQGARYDNIAIKTRADGALVPVTATITVCTAAGSGAPCTPTATIYSNQALSSTTSNPFTTDSVGNYGFWAAPGTYFISLTGSGLASPQTFTVTLPAGITSAGSTTFKTLNNINFCSQFSGSDNGLRCNAAMLALPAGGGLVYNDECGAQTWSTNIFSGVQKNTTLQATCGATYSVNVAQIPNQTNIRVRGIAGSGGNGGGTGTGISTISVNFASGDVFTPSATASAFELSEFNIVAGVTRTSGYVINVTPGSNMGYIHDLHIQNQYGTFKLFAGAATAINNWRFRNITWNCGSSSLHSGEFISLGSTDNTVTSSGHIFENFSSSGDVCIHDAAAIHAGSNTDSPAFVDWNFSISRTNTSTIPNWLFDNTLGGGISPRLVSHINIYSEGDGLAGNDIVQIASCTDCTFTNGDYGGGDHAFKITGGQGIKIMGGQVNNNNNGGVYVTSAVANLGLLIQGVDFYGDSITTANTFDDIQIADGTSGVSIMGNSFGNITSTVTGNLTRWPINILGTTSSQISIHGNESKTSKYGNTGLVRDVTGYQGETELDDGRTIIKRGTSNSSRIWLLGGAANNCFQIGVQENASNSFEITPSTAACAGGNPTFNKPVILCGATGTCTLNGTSQPKWALTNGQGTGVLNLQGPVGSATGTFEFDGVFGTYRVTADQTITAGASLANIPGLSWTMPANEALNLAFECYGSYSQATAAASSSFGIQDVTVAPTNIYARKVVWTSTTVALADNLPTLATTTATAIGATFTPSAATTVFNFEIQGEIEQPSNAGTSVVNIMAQFTTNNGTIKRGTACYVHPKGAGN